MAINKVVYGSNTLIDLTSDTGTADKVASGYTVHGASGSKITGTMGTIGANGLTWSQLTSKTWGIVSAAPTVTAHAKIVSPATSSQIVLPDSGYDYLSQVTVNAVSEVVLTKTLTYSSKVSTTQMIWTSAEFGDFPYGSLMDYESLSIMAKLTSASHTTYQILFANTFYPYFSYTTTSGYVHSGMLAYHGSSASAVYNARSSTAINGSVAGYFQVTTTGINLVCNSSYGLYGTYQFTLAAKLTT